MSMVGMLGKLLVSGAMSKGAGGNLLGSLLGGQSGQGGGADLGSLLGGLMGQAGGASGQQSGSAGGMGSLLGGDQANSGATAGGAAGGLGGLLGGLMGGGAAGGAGGLGGLLGAALGGQQGGAAAVPEPTTEQNDQAALLIRAMVNAAKCDGQVDAEEQQKIVGKLGDISAEEANFIRSEMAAPLDVAGFVRSVPEGLEQQIYLISLMAIDLDSRPEAEYLDQLAKGLGISQQASNDLHTQLNIPVLYG